MKNVLNKVLSLVLCFTLIAVMIPAVSLPASAAVAEPACQSQLESRWQSYYYGGTNRMNLYDSGCGIFSFCNAVHYLTGNNPSVTEVASWAANMGYLNGVYGGTDHRFHAAMGGQYGARFGFSVPNGSGTWANWSSSALKNHLANGGVAIGNVPNHYIAIVGYNASNNTFHIYDSAPYSLRGTNSNNGNVWLTESALYSYSAMTLSWYCLLSRTGAAPGWYPTSLSAGSAYNLGTDFNARIYNPAFDRYVQLDEDETVIGAEMSDDNSQIWRFERKGSDNSYKITNIKNGKNLDLKDGNSAPGTDIITWTNNDQDPQRWYLVAKNGGYTLQCKSAPKNALDIDGGDKTSIACWSEYTCNSQTFHIIPENNTILEEQFYAKIYNKTYDRYVGISGTEPLAQTESDSSGQIWKFELNKEKQAYEISSMSNGKYLDICNNPASGANIITNPYYGTDAQAWYLVEQNGGYTIRCKRALSNTMDISINDKSGICHYSANGTDNQIFEIIKVKDGAEALGSDFYAQIYNTAYNKNVGISSSGEPTAYAKSNDLSQVWHFILRDDGSYKIVNMSNSLCLDLYNEDTANGTNIITYKSNDANAQRWYLTPAGTGYSLQCKATSDKVLDISMGDYTGICNYTSSGTENQVFKIVKSGGYTVNHYVQNIDGKASSKDSTNYTLSNSETFSGIPGNKVSPALMNFDHRVNPAQVSLTPANDGSTVINYFYSLRYGDINIDDIVDAKDLIILKQKIMYQNQNTNELSEKLSDINGDGKVSLADMLRLKLYLADPTVEVGD